MVRRNITKFIALGVIVSVAGEAATSAQDEAAPLHVRQPSSLTSPAAEPLPSAVTLPSDPSAPIMQGSDTYLPHRFEYGHSQPLTVETAHGCPGPCIASCHGCNQRQFGKACKAELQYSHWGYPEEFHERPFGSLVRAYAQRHVVKGIAAQSALYQYDFFPPGDRDADALTPRGVRQLRKIASNILTHSVQVMIESSGDAELDAARKQHVFDQLAQLAVPVPVEQIVIGVPRPSGLQGVEAMAIYQNQISDTRSKGVYSGGGTAGGGTTNGAAIFLPTTAR